MEMMGQAVLAYQFATVYMGKDGGNIWAALGESKIWRGSS